MTLLYKISSANKVCVWDIQLVDLKDGTAAIEMHHGILGFRMKCDRLVLSEGKNVGRVNETTPLEQAKLEAESRVRKQIRLGYRATIEEAKDAKAASRRPMLAHTFQVRKHDLPDRVGMSPKLNGVRCLNVRRESNDNIIQISKGNKEFNYPFISDMLDNIMLPGEEIDGEVYLHGVSLRLIGKALKKRNELTDSLEYHIFDVPRIAGLDASDPFIDRYLALEKRLAELGDKVSCKVKLVPLDIDLKKNFMTYFNRAIAADYEGLMLRDLQAGYAYGERSSSIQKYKEKQDAEFEIVRVWTDRTGLIMFTCCLPDNRAKEFDVTPLGSDEERREMLAEGEAYYIGKLLTTQFSMFLDSGVPEHAKGVAVRDYE